MTSPYPPHLQAALAQLEAAEVDLDQRVANAKQLQRQMPQTTLSQQDIQQIEEHARSKNAPKQLRELQQRIDRGDLTWSDIANGRHLDDPKVQAALSTGVQGMRQAYTMIQEGHDVDEIIDIGGPPVATEPPAEPDEPPRPSHGGDDDEYFGRSIYDK